MRHWQRLLRQHRGVPEKYSKWWILPCVLLTLLTAFARNWLGAHTPQDVLVGMMIALVVLLLSNT